jgi:hypothetical protein
MVDSLVLVRSASLGLPAANKDTIHGSPGHSGDVSVNVEIIPYSA